MADLQPVFSQLAAILRPYAAKLVVKTDTDASLYLDTHHILKSKQPLFFGAVQMMKKYVSVHLMPVYVKPSLLEGISPGLEKRMQGKSCFNFTESDPALVKELKALVKAGYASYQEQGFV